MPEMQGGGPGVKEREQFTASVDGMDTPTPEVTDFAGGQVGTVPELSPVQIGHVDLAPPVPALGIDDIPSVPLNGENEPSGTDTFRVVMAGLDSNVDQFAREASQEKAARREHRGGFWRRTASKVWYTMTREYQVVKDTVKAREDILTNENLRHHQGKSDESWKQATVRRFSSDFAEQLIHQEAGETFHKLGAAEAAQDSNAQRIREDVVNLLRQYATGDIIDEDNLDAMLKDKRAEWREKDISQDYIGEGVIVAHNVAAIGDQLKAALETAEGLKSLELEKMLAKVEVVTGEAKVGSNVEIDATLSERLAEKMRNAPFLSEKRLARITSLLGSEKFMGGMLSAILNEEVVAGVLSATLYAAKKPISFIPGIGAAVVAGVRERRAMLDERALQGRRLDNDQEVDTSIKRQREIGETLHEGCPVSEIIAAMGTFYNGQGEFNFADHADLEGAMKLLGEIKAREHLYYVDHKRVLNFADLGSEEYEGRKTDLDSATAKFETDLKKLFDNPAEQGWLDIKPDETFIEWLTGQKDREIGAIRIALSEKDKLACRVITEGVLKKGLTAGVSAYFGGELAQAVAHEAVSIVSSLWSPEHSAVSMALADNSQPNVPDHIGGAPTVPEHIGGTPSVPDHIGNQPVVPDHIGGGQPTVPEQIGGEALPTHSVALSETSKINLPNGFTSEVHGSQVTVDGPNSLHYTGELTKDGTLSPSTVDALRAHGLTVSDRPETIQGTPTISHKEVSAADFARAHQHEMVKVKTVTWEENGTPKSDLNELDLQNHVTKDGHIRVSIKGMTAGGSFHGNEHVNWQEAAKQGKLMLYTSASPGSQVQAFELKFTPSGELDIDKNTPLGSLFDQHGNFLGFREQAAVKGAQLPDGTFKIASLATEVGRQHHMLNDVITTPKMTTGHVYTITPNTTMQPSAFFAPAAPSSLGIETPLYVRSSLGAGVETRPPEPKAPATGPTPPVATPPPVPGVAPSRSPRPNPKNNSSGGSVQPTPGGSPEQGGSGDYTREEQAIIDTLATDRRALPTGFDFDISNLGATGQKMLIVIAREAMSRASRLPEESLATWRRRVVDEMYNDAVGKLSNLDKVSAKMRPLVESVYKALLQTTAR